MSQQLRPCNQLVERKMSLMGRVVHRLEHCGRTAVLRDEFGDTYCKRHAEKIVAEVSRLRAEIAELRCACPDLEESP